MDGEPTVSDGTVRALIAEWKAARGETLSFTKAARRLKEAAASGCPLLRDCSKCPSVRECPVLK